MLMVIHACQTDYSTVVAHALTCIDLNVISNSVASSLDKWWEEERAWYQLHMCTAQLYVECSHNYKGEQKLVSVAKTGCGSSYI